MLSLVLSHLILAQQGAPDAFAFYNAAAQKLDNPEFKTATTYLDDLDKKLEEGTYRPEPDMPPLAVERTAYSKFGQAFDMVEQGAAAQSADGKSVSGDQATKLASTIIYLSRIKLDIQFADGDYNPAANTIAVTLKYIGHLNLLTKNSSLVADHIGRTCALVDSNRVRIGEKGWAQVISASESLLKGLEDPTVASTQLRILRLVGLRCIYQWVNDKPPAKLADFASPEQSLDPLTGKPFEYVPQAGDFRIYSTGIEATGPIDLTWPGSKRKQ